MERGLTITIMYAIVNLSLHNVTVSENHAKSLGALKSFIEMVM